MRKSGNIVIRSTIYRRQNTSEFISKIFILNHVFDLCENLVSHKVYLSKSLFSYTFDNIRLCEISLAFIVEREYINKNYKILFQSGILMVRMHISSVITYPSTIISNKNTCVYYTFTKLLNDYSRCQTIAYKFFLQSTFFGLNIFTRGSQNAALEPHATHGSHWCGSRKIPLIMLDFKRKVFYFIYLHKHKTVFPTLSQILYFRLRFYVFYITWRYSKDTYIKNDLIT
jgi:hypothetical protein